MLARWAVFLIVIVIAVKSDDECNIDQATAECSEYDIEPALEALKGFPREDFFDEICSPLLKALNCEMSFYERCDHPLELDPKLYEPVHDLITSLCNENADIRRGYLENVECYDSALPEMIGCAFQVGLIVRGLVEEHENETDFEHPEILPCLAIPLTIECIDKELTTTCSKEAAEPLVEIMQSFYRIASEIKCPSDLLPIWEEAMLSYLSEDEEDRKK